MTRVAVEGRAFDAELVVFDKDGTLIDFDHLWGRRTHNCIGALLAELGEPPEQSGLRAPLYNALGYDSVANRVAGDGPLATIPRHKLIVVTATVLYQYGIAWQQAEALASHVFAATMVIPPTPDDIRGLGNVAAVFAGLRAAGVRVAIATSDDRDVTRKALQLLEVFHHVDCMTCGDDAVAPKPAADGLLAIARELEVEPAKIMMVGDTDHDMLAGRNAGAGCCVGVLCGAGSREMLAVRADVLASSIESITVAV